MIGGLDISSHPCCCSLVALVGIGLRDGAGFSLFCFFGIGVSGDGGDLVGGIEG